MAVELDHLVVTAATLAEGVAHVEAALGVTLAPGGRHAAMGTWNRLLSLGPDLYLEVIAIDPGGPAPAHPRWYDLDAFSGASRLSHWALRCPRLEEALALCPPGSGRPMAFARGALRWRMAVPERGRLPFDDAFPALIEWGPPGPAAAHLPEAGCRLVRLHVAHPEAAALATALPLADPRIRVVPGPRPAFRAEIDTPLGPRFLE